MNQTSALNNPKNSWTVVKQIYKIIWIIAWRNCYCRKETGLKLLSLKKDMKTYLHPILVICKIIGKSTLRRVVQENLWYNDKVFFCYQFIQKVWLLQHRLFHYK